MYKVRSFARSRSSEDKEHLSQGARPNIDFTQLCFKFLVDFFSAFGSIDLNTVVFVLELLDNGFGLIFKSI